MRRVVASENSRGRRLATAFFLPTCFLYFCRARTITFLARVNPSCARQTAHHHCLSFATSSGGDAKRLSVVRGRNMVITMRNPRVKPIYKGAQVASCSGPVRPPTATNAAPCVYPESCSIQPGGGARFSAPVWPAQRGRYLAWDHNSKQTDAFADVFVLLFGSCMRECTQDPDETQDWCVVLSMTTVKM